MATIKVDPNTPVDPAGTTFTQRGVKDTYAPTITKFLGDQALAAHKGFALSRADTASKSLLEEFTQSKALASIQKEILDSQAQETELFQSLVSATGGGEISRTQDEIKTLQSAQKEMLLRREAVAQRRLSESEFRLRAEARYYELVSKSPGLKQELAAIMSERLGFNPQGQESKQTMAARRSSGTSIADTIRKKQVTAIMAEGMYDGSLSADENIARSWSAVQKRVANRQDVIDLTSSINAQGTIDKKDVVTRLKNIQTSELINIGNFGDGTTAYSTPLKDIRAMDDQERNDKINIINQNAQQAIDVLTTLGTQYPTLVAPYIKAVEDQRDLYLSIMDGTQDKSVTANNYAIAKNQNEYLIATESAGILATQKDMLTIAAYSRIFPTSNIADANIQVQNSLVKAMSANGHYGVDNLGEDLTPEEQAQQANAFSSLLQSTAQRWDTLKNSSDNDIQRIAHIVSTVVTGDVTKVPDMLRQHVMRTMALPGFMERIASIDPATAGKIARNTLHMQASLGANYNKFLVNAITDYDLLGKITPSDFFIRKVDSTGGWTVDMTDQGRAQVLPFDPKIKGPIPERFIGARNDKVEGTVMDIIGQVRGNTGNFASNLNNFIKSKAAIMGVSEEEAAKMVARDLGVGLSNKDVPKGNLSPQNVSNGKQTSSIQQDKASKKLAQIQELKAAFPDASLPEIQSFIQDHLA